MSTTPSKPGKSSAYIDDQDSRQNIYFEVQAGGKRVRVVSPSQVRKEIEVKRAGRESVRRERLDRQVDEIRQERMKAFMDEFFADIWDGMSRAPLKFRSDSITETRP